MCKIAQINYTELCLAFIYTNGLLAALEDNSLIIDLKRRDNNQNELMKYYLFLRAFLVMK